MGICGGQVAGHNHGLFQPGKPVPQGYAPYHVVADAAQSPGYTRYWDPAASVPYLYNADKQIFISYEDAESLAAKCKYVLSHKLAASCFGITPEILQESFWRPSISHFINPLPQARNPDEHHR